MKTSKNRGTYYSPFTIYEKDMEMIVYGILSSCLIIPGLSEPPVRTLRATIPENGSHIFR